MNPSIDDRLASIVHSLTDIILPSLPPGASIAQEQAQLAIGHLQIIRAQLDAVPGFEAEELHDARKLGEALLSEGAGGAATVAALVALRAALDQPTHGEHPRQSRIRINGAVEELIRQTATDGTASYRAALAEIVVRLQSERALKDRKWFAPMGFDRAS